jgi:hypothetical protein
MKTGRAFFLVGLLAWVGLTGCDGNGRDRCAGVVCDTPPVDACEDATTRISYAAQGTCQAATGECTYLPATETCPEVCREGRCQAADPCAGVTCDSPPPPACQGDAALLVYSSPGTCSPADGTCSYPSEAQACLRVCEAGVCDPDIGDDFALLARDGTRLCSRWSALGVRDSYTQRAQVQLRAGLHRLPRDQASFELDLVEALLLGPDGAPATPTGLGTVERSLSGTPTDGTYTYVFRRPYDTPQGAQELEISASFQVTGGQPEVAIKAFDDLVQLNQQCWLDPSVSLAGAVSGTSFGTCQFDDAELFSGRAVEIRAENGDELRARLRLSFKCCCLLPGDFAELVSFRYTRGGVTAEATGFYQRAFSAVHHFFGQTLMAVFDAPIGQVAGVIVEGADAADAAGATITTLDAELSVLETLPVASIQQIEE